MSNSDDDQRNNQNSPNQRFEAEDGSNGMPKGRKSSNYFLEFNSI